MYSCGLHVEMQCLCLGHDKETIFGKRACPQCVSVPAPESDVEQAAAKAMNITGARRIVSLDLIGRRALERTAMEILLSSHERLTREVELLTKAGIKVRCCFAGVAQACPIHESA
jgi:hypothetical protein